jgi:hypothetical protein
VLKQENLMIKHQQKQLLQEGHHSQELIQSLVNDRNAALTELEKIVALYDQHALREESDVANELRAVALDTQRAKEENKALHASREQQKQSMLTSVPPFIPKGPASR